MNLVCWQVYFFYKNLLGSLLLFVRVKSVAESIRIRLIGCTLYTRIYKCHLSCTVYTVQYSIGDIYKLFSLKLNTLLQVSEPWVLVVLFSQD